MKNKLYRVLGLVMPFFAATSAAADSGSTFLLEQKRDVLHFCAYSKDGKFSKRVAVNASIFENISDPKKKEDLIAGIREIIDSHYSSQTLDDLQKKSFDSKDFLEIYGINSGEKPDEQKLRKGLRTALVFSVGSPDQANDKIRKEISALLAKHGINDTAGICNYSDVMSFRGQREAWKACPRNTN